VQNKLEYGWIMRLREGQVEIQATFWQEEGMTALDQALNRLRQILAEKDPAAISPKDPRSPAAGAGGNGENK